MLKLAYNMGYWTGRPPEDGLHTILDAERLGFDSVWFAEAYGSDCISPLAWWGSRSTTVRLGTAVMQMSARTPAAAAMAAMTLDHLTDGRFVLGLGVSGPQVVEGWYGQPYERPLARTREYVEVVREVVRRERPLEHHGQFYPLPYAGGTGLGKPLRSTVHPFRTDLPIYVGAEGPKNVALAAEIGDGWFPLFFAARDDDTYRALLDEGFARSGDSEKAKRFEVVATVHVVPGDDVEQCADSVRPYLALYVGGMGAPTANFHYDVFVRMGYESVVAEVQRLYLAGRREAAAAAIPLEMVEAVALVGPRAKIRDELAQWNETCMTTIMVSPPRDQLPALAELLLG